MLSRKSVAKEFKAGVKKLLHELRTGKSRVFGFDEWIQDPEAVVRDMTRLDSVIVIMEALRDAQAKIEQDKPKVLLAEAITASEDCINVGQLAKILNQKGIDTGEKRLFEWLRENRYLGRVGAQYNYPTQRAMEMKLFEIKEPTLTDSEGNTMIRFTPKVTGKGQSYFINLFLSDKTENPLSWCLSPSAGTGRSRYRKTTGRLPPV